MRHLKRVPESGNVDARGEFAVRLPAASAVYVIKATAPGSTRDTKEVRFVAEERQDVVQHI